MINTIGFVADSHCGAVCGLTPPSYWNEHTPPLVKWLWNDAYIRMIAEWPVLDLLVFVGDLIDGKNSKSSYTGLITGSLGEQTQIAIEAFAPICEKANAIRRVEGTPYHESFEGPLGEFDRVYNVIQPEDAIAKLVFEQPLDGGAAINVKHEPAYRSMIYPSTPLRKELLDAHVAETLYGIPSATHLIRAHVHTTDGSPVYGFEKTISICPCLCLQSGYAIKRHYYKWIPTIGGLLMQRDPRGFKGWRIDSFEYPINQAKRIANEKQSATNK